MGKHLKDIGILAALAAVSLAAQEGAFGKSGRSLPFSDDFEKDLSQWELPNPSFARRVESGNPPHGTVLELTPNNTAACALVRGSIGWENYCVEGEVLFPASGESYFGLVYGYRQNAGRTDFGCIYVKGNGSYVAVNPHLDGNASRALYEERRVFLPPGREIQPGRWYPFKAEVIGSTCHFYFQEMQVPVVTFGDWQYSSGQMGFKPRLLGSAFWLDNIRARPITDLAYRGTPQPSGIDYQPHALLTEWKALGPFSQRMLEVESAKEPEKCDLAYKGEHRRFLEFTSDSRGCLVTGRICRYTTDEKYAYFLASPASGKNTDAWLELSTTDEMGVWVNSVFIGNVPKQDYAWYDFSTNPKHKGCVLKIPLRSGRNHLLLCVKGGNYSGDGFYARIAPIDDRKH
jgi:hypothetical protein